MERQQLSPPADPPETAPVKKKKKRTHPEISYPDAEVIAMSPESLMATNRFICEVCKKGFQREQNLQLHRRGHNLPWKLRQKNSSSTKQVSKRRVYLCPEPTCVHHHPSRALGDLTGIKKHFSRKHGEKKWNCDKCDKRYAVLSDWKAHSKTCGTRDYRCDCGILFSRRDSFITHRAFCGVLLPQETGSRVPSCHLYGSNSGTGGSDNLLPNFPPSRFLFDGSNQDSFPSLMQHRIPDLHVSKDMQFDQHHMIASDKNTADYNNIYNNQNDPFVFDQFSAGNNIGVNTNSDSFNIGSFYNNNQSAFLLPQMSATALLQKAAEMGATTNGNSCVFENITGGPIQHEPMVDHEAHLQGLINSLATGNIAGMFGQDVQHAGGWNVHPTDHDAGVLTRDFLGVEREPDPTKFTQQIPHDGANFQ